MAGPDDLFGGSVALRGDLALVGASQVSPGGKALLYSRSGTVWTMRPPILLPLNGELSDDFGCSVAFGQDGLIIGSSGGGNADQGEVYFFENNCMATVSAASYDGTQQAPESIVAGFGRNLSSGALSANELPLPTTLGTHTCVSSTAWDEAIRAAFLRLARSDQLSDPGGHSARRGLVLVNRSGIVAACSVMIANVAPGLFTANSDGGVVPAALAFRLKGSGAQSYEPVAKFDSALGRFVPVPIDLGPRLIRSFSFSSGPGSDSAARCQCQCDDRRAGKRSARS